MFADGNDEPGRESFDNAATLERLNSETELNDTHDFDGPTYTFKRAQIGGEKNVDG